MTVHNSLPAMDDGILQAALLLHVVLLHPLQLTVRELVRELGADAEDFGDRDDIERAVRELVRIGLLHRSGSLVQPSQAALRSYELWQGVGLS